MFASYLPCPKHDAAMPYSSFVPTTYIHVLVVDLIEDLATCSLEPTLP